jgi:spore maturation protein SpmA
MMMNVSANMLGLDNAATPLGLTAMRELQTLNRQPDTATNAQIMFIVLNTAGLTLIPTSVIAIRQAMAVKQGLANFNAADIFLPTLLATGASCLAGLLAVAWVQRLNLFKLPVLAAFSAMCAAVAGLFVWLRHAARSGQPIGRPGRKRIHSLVDYFVFGLRRHPRMNVYDAFIDGAKEGFGVAVQIIPYLVAILVAIGLFRASGCMDVVMRGLTSAFTWLGMDTAFVPALPVGLMKISRGRRARINGRRHGDLCRLFQARLAAIIQGSTETTFYVLAVYSAASMCAIPAMRLRAPYSRMVSE